MTECGIPLRIPHGIADKSGCHHPSLMVCIFFFWWRKHCIKSWNLWEQVWLVGNWAVWKSMKRGEYKQHQMSGILTNVQSLKVLKLCWMHHLHLVWPKDEGLLDVSAQVVGRMKPPEQSSWTLPGWSCNIPVSVYECVTAAFVFYMQMLFAETFNSINKTSDNGFSRKMQVKHC